MSALLRAFAAPLRPLRGAVRVTRVTPAVESILCAVEDRRAWERDVAAWAARERRVSRNAINAAAWLARRIAAGLCGSCGTQPRAEGRSVCDRCRRRIDAAQVRLRGARVARGLCARCGEGALLTATRCAECVERKAVRT